MSDQPKSGLFGWFSNKSKQAEGLESEPNESSKTEEIEALEESEHLQTDNQGCLEQEASQQEDTSPDLAESSSASVDSQKETSPEENKKSFFQRLKSGLSKTRTQFSQGLADLVLGQKEIDDDLLEELETLLLMADVGVDTCSEIIDDLTQKSARKELKDSSALIERLKHLLMAIVEPVEKPLEIPNQAGPFVILMVGVNGVGKTTTIGKLAHQFMEQGKSVMLAAGDTFRAAAVEQLKAWGDRNQVPVVAQHTGADSASVIFDAFEAAKARKVDILIADTAGRLHNKSNLMDELAKVKRVLGKTEATAPHEVMLVVDAGTGQNALVQASEFNKSVALNSVTITKLDGTAKGGVVFAMANKMKLPIRYIGVGESKEDLRPFNATEYVDALFEN